jgi:hypothetical protein
MQMKKERCFSVLGKGNKISVFRKKIRGLHSKTPHPQGTPCLPGGHFARLVDSIQRKYCAENTLKFQTDPS